MPARDTEKHSGLPVSETAAQGAMADPTVGSADEVETSKAVAAGVMATRPQPGAAEDSQVERPDAGAGFMVVIETG